MIVTAMAERWAPPMPTPSAVGSSPKLIACVVYRIVRCRVRHASTIA
jgi:hypothetical protein